MSAITYQEAVQKFCDFDQNSPLKFAATPNAEIMLESKQNPALKNFLQNCSLNFTDSISLLWAAECNSQQWSLPRAVFELAFLPFRKKYWQAIPETISGADIFSDICAEAARKHQKIFLIGGLPTAAAKTVKILNQKFPDLEINFYEGMVNSETEPLIIQQIKDFGAEIIFTALGCPKQELCLSRILPQIPSAKMGMGIGGTLDFFAGIVPRAPFFMRKLGLEWFYRLIREPRRIKRIWRAVVVFPVMVLKGR